jgi:hypothetical protein
MALPTEYTEWQWPLSGVLSIMRVKSAQAGGGGGCMPTPFHYIYHHVQNYIALYAPAERADTLPLFFLYPYMYSALCLVSWRVHRAHSAHIFDGEGYRGSKQEFLSKETKKLFPCYGIFSAIYCSIGNIELIFFNMLQNPAIRP